MIKTLHIDSNYTAILPVNMTGNSLLHRTETGEWESKFVLYDWGGRQYRSIRPVWLDDSRKVLAFEHFPRNDPNALHSGRIQIQNTLPPNTSLIEESRRMRIHFEKGNGWIALAEWWAGSTWNNDQYASRISMGYQSPQGLYFYMDKQKLGENLWRPVWNSTPFPVPVGQWFDLYVRLRAGDKNTGLFLVAFKLPGGTWNRKVDIQDYTYNPDAPAPIAPDFTNPLMLYTGASTIQEVTGNGWKCRVDLRTFEQWTE